MDNPVKISVIIPVYNVEEYVEKSVRSIMDQTYSNLEIICVNDGSKDNSLAILKKLAEEDERIVLIDKPNGGVAEARNMGLEQAHGEWVTFIDSDDFLDREAYSTAVSVMHTKADMIHFGADMIGGIEDDPYFRLPDEGLYDADSIKLSKGGWSIWNKLFRKEILDCNSIRFAKIRYAEDFAFTLSYRFCIDKIYYLPQKFYKYIVRKNSAMSSLARKSPYAIDNLTGLDALYAHVTSGYPDKLHSHVEELVDFFILMFNYSTELSVPKMISGVEDYAIKMFNRYDFLQQKLKVLKHNKMLIFMKKDEQLREDNLSEKLFSIRKERYAYSYCKVIKLFGCPIYIKR